MQVFTKLREAQLYLSRKKVELYTDSVECLGHLINSRGIHADANKMAKVQEWCKPHTYNDVLIFLGLVQYLALYMPDIMVYIMPLSGYAKDNCVFEWTPLLDKCFEFIKHLVVQDPILKPIDLTHSDTIWVITDRSNIGVGAVYGQGSDWLTCQPAGFLSKKFSAAQHNYWTHEYETITILEALLKWEDKLLRQAFTLVTDNRACQLDKLGGGSTSPTSTL
jgi:hypothetical protein